MDFDYKKKMLEDKKAFMDSYKMNVIYTEELMPLKAKISQILLYDTEAAKAFLQEYNEMIKREEESEISTIIEDIISLQLKIDEYENNRGKEKLYKQQSITIIRQLEELEEKCKELSIKEFEKEFCDIKDLYNESSKNYSFKDRDSIEQKIAILQARLIMRKAKDGALDLYNEISEDDKPRLIMAMNNSIVNLMMNPNPEIQNIANQIKYKMMERTDAVYDPEIWRLLDTIENNKEDRKYEQHKIENASTTLLPAISKETKKFKFPSLRELFNIKTLKVGNRKMRLSTTIQMWGKEIKAQDLSKIDMKSICDAKLIPEIPAIVSTKMGGKRYYPDERTKIYDFFTRDQSEDLELEYDFFDQDKTKMQLYIYELDVFGKSGTIEIGNEQKKLYGVVFIDTEIRKNIVKVCKYAKFIDEFTGSKLERPLFDEVGVFFLNFIYAIRDGKIDEKDKTELELLDKLPIFSNLQRSYCNIEQYVVDTEASFRQKEERKKKKTEFFQGLSYQSDDKYRQWVPYPIDKMHIKECRPDRQKYLGADPRKISLKIPESWPGDDCSEER